MRIFPLAVLLTCVSTGVTAEDHAESGEPLVGEALFGRQCVSCHIVADSDGTLLAGRNARTGPNLYEITTRGVAQETGYRYGEALAAVGLSGAMWSQDAFVAYVQDPTDWLRLQLEDRRARSKMAFKVRTPEEALDLYAYLESLTAPAE